MDRVVDGGAAAEESGLEDRHERKAARLRDVGNVRQGRLETGVAEEPGKSEVVPNRVVSRLDPLALVDEENVAAVLVEPRGHQRAVRRRSR